VHKTNATHVTKKKELLRAWHVIIVGMGFLDNSTIGPARALNNASWLSALSRKNIARHDEGVRLNQTSVFGSPFGTTALGDVDGSCKRLFCEFTSCRSCCAGCACTPLFPLYKAAKIVFGCCPVTAVACVETHSLCRPSAKWLQAHAQIPLCPMCTQ
jgi:hypothetical protein